MTTLFWIAVGALVGWNLPQPSWAKNAQDAVAQWIKNKIR